MGSHKVADPLEKGHKWVVDLERLGLHTIEYKANTVGLLCTIFTLILRLNTFVNKDIVGCEVQGGVSARVL